MTYSSPSSGYIEIFCKRIRSRSAEHRMAVQLLCQGNLPSQIVAILRQELDSMIRVIYLLSISNSKHRVELIQASIEGKIWRQTGKKGKITDKDMLLLANKMQGWSESVYRFGCGFIHLSNFHDYRFRDPLEQINSAEKETILKYMRYYHGGPLDPNPTFNDLLPYLPSVFEKITSNLECYLKDLEIGRNLDEEG